VTTRRWLAATILLVLAATVAAIIAARLVQSSPAKRAREDSAAFARWAAGPNVEGVRDLQRFLTDEGVADVAPLADLLRSDARWRSCRAEPFALPARAQWAAMVPTLRYIRDHVVPAVGPVRVVSGNRSAAANSCFKGAKASRHLRFAALDLEPRGAITRTQLIAALCPLHARTGARFAVGLGIYRVTRFHIDTAGFRRWGHDYRGTSSPCLNNS
jgi:Peptidase M15